MFNNDDVDAFVNEHVDRKKTGENRYKSKKQKKEGERRVKSVGRKQKWHFDRNHSYEDD